MSDTSREKIEQLLALGAVPAHVVRALLDERDQLWAEQRQILTRLSSLLTGVADALKGPPASPLSLHGWSGLPELARAERDRREQAEARVKELEAERTARPTARSVTTSAEERAYEREVWEREVERLQWLEPADAAEKLTIARRKLAELKGEK